MSNGNPSFENNQNNEQVEQPWKRNIIWKCYDYKNSDHLF